MARKSAKRAADRVEMVQWLFENSRDLMHVVSSDGRFLLVNPAWTEVTGLSAAELIGNRCLGMVRLSPPVEAGRLAHRDHV